MASLLIKKKKKGKKKKETLCVMLSDVCEYLCSSNVCRVGIKAPLHEFIGKN